MGSDLLLVFRWWGTLFLVGAFAYPLTKRLFSSWWDHGYLFAKAVGMAAVTYFVYLFGILHIMPFTVQSVWLSLGVVFAVGLWINLSNTEYGIENAKKAKFPFQGKQLLSKRSVTFLLEELFFFAALLFWSWIKGHEPSIHNLEKFMDFGFTKSILNSAYFPAPDMWYQGFSINYYYFGHTVMAMLTRLSGIDLAVTFNLMLATIFAFTFTMSFSIGYQLIGDIRKIGNTGKLVGAIFTAFLVTLAGNMQTIYAFTQGYTGDQLPAGPPPFWKLLWPIGGFLQNLPAGLDRYWYANATRFIPYTIHEFPSYSFVVSDVHGHVLSIPFVLLAMGLLILMFGSPHHAEKSTVAYIFYGFLCSVLLMTNALDGPIYLGLFLILWTVTHWATVTKWKAWLGPAMVVGVTLIVSIPFLAHFSSFVTGLAVNCPPAFLANHKIGPLLFEGVEKCQHSPIWMMWLLWGFFIYCGTWFVWKVWKQTDTKNTQTNHLLTVFFIISILLIIFPEFFYFKDIYPMHFRSNTMFKLGYQAFMMFSIVSGYTIVKAVSERRHKIFLLFLIPQLLLVSIYPLFSVRSYFDSLRTYKGLYGLSWLVDEYPDNFAAIGWLNEHAICRIGDASCQNPVIVEADGDSYTDYEQMSAFTGLPTIVGWAVHEWLWRGSYDVVAPRRSEVQTIYDPGYLDNTELILQKYHVRYIIVGTSEWQKYPKLSLAKFASLGKLVFTHGQTSIYEINP